MIWPLLTICFVQNVMQMWIAAEAVIMEQMDWADLDDKIQNLE